MARVQHCGLWVDNITVFCFPLFCKPEILRSVEEKPCKRRDGRQAVPMCPHPALLLWGNVGVGGAKMGVMVGILAEARQ